MYLNCHSLQDKVQFESVTHQSCVCNKCSFEDCVLVNFGRKPIYHVGWSMYESVLDTLLYYEDVCNVHLTVF